MYLRQLFDSHLAQYSYLIGCQKTGEAIVIDPLRDIEQYQSAAADQGLSVTAAAETHIHADFVSGARELAARDQRVKLFLSGEGGPDWQSEWASPLAQATILHDGDVFRVGNIKFQALHTPGHTPEHLSYLVTDEGGGATEPMALLSGDFLFVGDVGRPDLLEQAAGLAGTQEAGALQLYHSLKRLGSLPDYLQVLPAHGAGSACGKSLGAVPFSTLGYEKRFNHALRLALRGSEQEFVASILQGQPEPPMYFAHMKNINRSGPEVLGGPVTPSHLSIRQVATDLTNESIVVLDSRADRGSYATAHLKGSLYASTRGDYSGLAGSYLAPSDRIVLVVDDAREVESLVRQLVRIGFHHVIGWIKTDEVYGAPESHLASLPTVKFSEAAGILQTEPRTTILDARRADEYKAGHLKGALNIAHTRLKSRMSELPDTPLLVHCASGMRAASAAAFLEKQGRSVTYVNDAFTHAPAELLATSR